MKRKFELEFDASHPLEQEFLEREDLLPRDIKQILLLGYSLFKTGATELFRDAFQQQLEEREQGIRAEYGQKLEAMRKEQMELLQNFDTRLDRAREDMERRYHYEIAAWEAKLQHSEESRREVVQRCKDLEQDYAKLYQEGVQQLKEMLTRREGQELDQRVHSEVQAWMWRCQQLEEERQRHWQRCEQLEGRLNAFHHNMYEESVQRLKEQLQEKEVEIRVLKNTNRVKGTLGEGLIQAALRSKYHDADVCDMSHVSHVCDVHMTMPSGKKLVFESKYKQAVDRKDVQKFYHDMGHMGEDVLGGVFVSVLSKNIPGKGSIAIEHLSDNQKMVLFLGFSDETDFHTYFLPYVDMFWNICSFHGRKTNKEMNLQLVLDEINFYYQMIAKNKARLDDFKGKFHKFSLDVENDHKELMTRIENVLRHHSYQPNVEVVGPPPSKKMGYTCDHCNQAFTNKKVFLKHVKDAHGGLPHMLDGLAS